MAGLSRHPSSFVLASLGDRPFCGRCDVRNTTWEQVQLTVTMVSVMSADGRGTKWDLPGTSDWQSREDHEQFARIRKEHDVTVMGRKTWSSVKSIIKLSHENPRFVLTSTPEKFKSEETAGMLEFSNEQPAALLSRLKARGLKRVFLVGGAETNASFLEAGLVDEIITTVEPQIFGDGRPLVDARRLDIPLVLKRSETLNSRGTLLLHYKVDRSQMKDAK